MDPDDGPIDAANLGYAERMQRRFREDPGSVSESWRSFFGERWSGGPTFAPHEPTKRSIFDPRYSASPTTTAILLERVGKLVRAHVELGHLAARIDPLGRAHPRPPELDPGFHGIERADLDRRVPFGFEPDRRSRSVRSILRRLRESYCGSLTVQADHVRHRDLRTWIRRRMEARRGAPEREQRLRLLRRLTEAFVFEEFLRKKFVGAKSYSLEGGESLLLFLDAVVDDAGAHGLDEIVLAMPHRGRLNVLANLLDKPARRIFREFLGNADAPVGGGDLRHHLGASTDRETTSGRTIHLSLCFNPSHLEFIGPIALGRVRAKQDREGDAERERGMALMIHGDAALAGEGIVQEVLQLSRLDAYTTGGTVHLVLDNQIGFTTPPEEGRSSSSAADVATSIGAPIFHVNGDDPEAVLHAASIAMDFRSEHGRDVVVDLRCYRRFGHNEVDEPRFTQPGMYAIIDELPPVHELYARRLVDDGDVPEKEVERMRAEAREPLEEELERAREWNDGDDQGASEPTGVWEGFHGGPVERRDEVETGVDRERTAELLRSIARVPAGFRPHEKVERLLQRRREMADGERELDWATAEALAFASLAVEGFPVRLSGQDSARGTFSQRHAVLVDQETGERHEPLQHLAPDQEPVEILNSPLSEAGVLGFEYGYSLDRPSSLVLWEAQFGDFANAAQVILDQFVTSAEDKWRRLSGLVLLLPHGFDGQGPEHSSARLERFLVSAAEDDVQVVQPSTPAQFFHVLRRQALQRWRKPLVVMTPKSLLRNDECVSSLADLSAGSFRRVIAPHEARERAESIVLCSGKLYYELESERAKRERDDVALVRIEELHPFPERELRAALEGFPDGTPVTWAQAEPENMGAWRHLRARFLDRLFDRFPFRGAHRPASASPAGGSMASHRALQGELIRSVFEE